LLFIGRGFLRSAAKARLGGLYPLFHKILVAADAPRMKLLFVLLHSVLEAYLIANEDLEL
jgi:hypothetical protein